MLEQKQLELRILDAGISTASLREYCQKVMRYKIHSVAVFTSRLEEVSFWLEESLAEVCAIVGYPGAQDSDVKRYEIEVARDLGAQRLLYFPNITIYVEGLRKRVLRELADAREAAEEIPLIVIADTVPPAGLPEFCDMVSDLRIAGISIDSSGPNFNWETVLEEKKRLRVQVHYSAADKLNDLRNAPINEASITPLLFDAVMPNSGSN